MAFTCSICDTESPTISGLCSHIRMIHPLGCLSSYKCCFCPNKVYGTVSLLRKHLVKQHSANEREFIDNVEGANINVIIYDIEIEPDHDNNETR